MYNQAVEEEGGLNYSKPQNWHIPARQYPSANVLKMNLAEPAEIVYRKCLFANPGNGLSLPGMYNRLLAQRKMNEAAEYKTRYVKALREADVIPRASVF